MIDLRWRGGTVMMSRFISPEERDLVGHRVDVPVRLELNTWSKQTKNVLDKCPEIRGKDCPEYPLRRSMNGRVHHSPP
jgi:hypothetical protein